MSHKKKEHSSKMNKEKKHEMREKKGLGDGFKYDMKKPKKK